MLITNCFGFPGCHLFLMILCTVVAFSFSNFFVIWVAWSTSSLIASLPLLRNQLATALFSPQLQPLLMKAPQFQLHLLLTTTRCYPEPLLTWPLLNHVSSKCQGTAGAMGGASSLSLSCYPCMNKEKLKIEIGFQVSFWAWSHWNVGDKGDCGQQWRDVTLLG